MEMVDKVVPIRIPPPISIAIEVALAETTAPTKAMSGGIAARYLRSRTSDSLPTMGDKTLCMSSGPSAKSRQYKTAVRTASRTLTDDPPSDRRLAQISNYEGYDGTSRDNDVDLGHNGEAGHKNDHPGPPGEFDMLSLLQLIDMLHRSYKDIVGNAMPGRCMLDGVRLAVVFLRHRNGGV